MSTFLLVWNCLNIVHCPSKCVNIVWFSSEPGLYWGQLSLGGRIVVHLLQKKEPVIPPRNVGLILSTVKTSSPVTVVIMFINFFTTTQHICALGLRCVLHWFYNLASICSFKCLENRCMITNLLYCPCLARKMYKRYSAVQQAERLWRQLWRERLWANKKRVCKWTDICFHSWSRPDWLWVSYR